jgi:hypothetical protein
MEGERLGRVVAVALLALLTPVACAALGVGTPSVSGLPPSDGSASPAVQPYGGEEATTADSTEDVFPNTVHQAGYWAVPVGQQDDDMRVIRGSARSFPLFSTWSTAT